MRSTKRKETSCEEKRGEVTAQRESGSTIVRRVAAFPSRATSTPDDGGVRPTVARERYGEDRTCIPPAMLRHHPRKMAGQHPQQTDSMVLLERARELDA